jgi:hypothetical protein
MFVFHLVFLFEHAPVPLLNCIAFTHTKLGATYGVHNYLQQYVMLEYLQLTSIQFNSVQ